MFKALAEFVMRGRISAITIALVGSWLPFVSQATLGLVTLRKGWQEGLLITLWASLPAFVGLWMGQVAAPIALASIAVFFVGYLASFVLRFSISWSITLVAIVALSTLATLVVIAVSDGFVSQVASFFEELLTPPEGSLSEEARAFIDGWTQRSAGGLIACWIGVGALAGLFFARWWQALLYNPGGFQQEFHQLRLPIGVCVISAGAWLYGILQGEDFQLWASFFGMPLWVCGMGLVHWLVARFKLGIGALVAMYVILPILPVGVMILILLALLDAGLDLRSKLKIDQSSTD